VDCCSGFGAEWQRARNQGQIAMTREELERQYAVNKKGVIITPGKFAGQMLYVPYFWDKYLSGYADDTNGDFITFFITDEERREYPELRQAEIITLLEIEHTLICELPGRSTNVELKRKLQHPRSRFFRLFRKGAALTEAASAESEAR
jgi:hypothetical protein